MDTNVAEIGGVRLVIRALPEFKRQVEWLFRMIQNAHSDGLQLGEGVRLQAGWSVLTLRKQPDDSLLVCEPDFLGNPFVDESDSVRWSFEIPLRQNAFASHVEAGQRAISFQDKIVMQKNVFNAASLVFTRSEPRPGDSGWFIAARAKYANGAELEAIYAYQLIALKPAVLDAMTLPEGYMVMVEGEKIAAVADPEDHVRPL
jgi:hypothetical protein